MKSKILFVDDEPNVLQAYQRNLRNLYSIFTAISGDEALRTMVSNGPFDVIISDMSMPEMDGAEFLAKAQKIHPDTVRIMLTGNADQQTAIRAVNEGNIFRFINKPCPPEEMAEAVNSAIQQYDLITLEKKILEDTVNGCIKSLVEVMSLSQPEIFGRTNYYKNLALGCAQNLGIEKLWEIEASAMLSLIGTICLPDNIAHSFVSGKQVTETEAKQFQSHPIIGSEIIKKIPRLENVSNAIHYQKKNYDGTGFPNDDVKHNNIPVAARILRVVISYELLERKGLTKEQSIKKLQKPNIYDPAVVEALEKAISNQEIPKTKDIRIDQLEEGMFIAQDIITSSGSVLICKGQQVTPTIIGHLKNFLSLHRIDDKACILIKPEIHDAQKANQKIS